MYGCHGAACLPLPDGEVPTKVITHSARTHILDLGAGLVFASAALANPQEVDWREVFTFPVDLQAKILLFDWWVHNEDRSLSGSGGNPNLLITMQGGRRQGWAFDFNLAFDETFSVAAFWQFHVFAQTQTSWPRGFRETMTPALEACSARIDDLFDHLPIEWLYLDGDASTKPVLDQALVRATLARAFDKPEEFWRRS